MKRPVPFALALALLLCAASSGFAEIRKVLIIPFSHQDIGFTATQEQVGDVYRDVYDRLPGMLGKIPGMRFTVETFWQFDQWLDSQPSEDELRYYTDAARAGTVEFTASYGSMHSGFMNGFSLSQALQPALSWARSRGVEIATCMMNDVPGYTQDLPDVLAGAGLRYFMTGPNQVLAPCIESATEPFLFWWEGPAGGKVLTWVASDGYMEGLIIKSLSDLEAYAARIERGGYPYDTLPVMVAGDNRGYAPGVIAYMSYVKDAARSKGLAVEFGTPSQFFRHIEERYASSIPVRRGDWSGWWEILKNSSPRSASLGRWSQSTLASLARDGLLDTRSASFAFLRRDMLTYLEHAGHGSSGWPGLLTQEQLDASNARVVQYADALAAGTRRLVDQAFAGKGTLPAGVRLVYNASGTSAVQRVVFPCAPRGGNVPVVSLDGRDYRCRPYSGDPADPWCPVGEGFEFSASLGKGFSRFRVARWEGQSPDAPPAGALENRFYRLELSPDGSIARLRDRESGREIAGPGFGDLYESDNPLIVRDADLRRVSAVLEGSQVSARGEDVRAELRFAQGPLRSLRIELGGSRKELRLTYLLSRTAMPFTPYERHSRNYYIRFPVGRGLAFSYQGPASEVSAPFEFTAQRPPLLAVRDRVRLSGPETDLRFASREAFMAGYYEQEGYLLYHLLRRYNQASVKDKGIVDMNEVEAGGADLLRFSFLFTSGTAVQEDGIEAFEQPAIAR